jgi:hypothetical protein
METSHATIGRQADSEQNSNVQPKNKTQHRKPRVKMDGAAKQTTHDLIYEEEEVREEEDEEGGGGDGKQLSSIA